MTQPEGVPFHKSIRITLRAMVMVVCVIPVLGALIGVTSLLNQRMEQMLEQRVRDSAAIAANIFRQYSEDLLLKARLVSENRQIADLVVKRDKIALINQLSALHQDLNLSLYGAGIEIFDQDGRLAVAEPKRATQQVPDPMIYTVRKRGEFKISTFFQQDQLIVSAALPLYHPSQATPVGVVALSYQVSHKLADEIRKIAGAEVLFYVHPLGGEPRILATTLDERSSEELVGKYARGALHLRDRPEYLLTAIRGSARNGEYRLASAAETGDMLGVIASLTQILYLIMALAAVLAFAAAYFFSQRFVSQILYLDKAAGRVKRGELEQPIALESSNELGLLASHLDAMRREIKSTLEEQKVMIERLTVRDRINSVIVRLSGTELLKQVLKIILDDVGAQNGSIMLMNENSGKLEFKVTYDPRTGSDPRQVIDEVALRLGEGIAGQVAATGVATISNDTRSDKRFKTYRFQENERSIRNIACVPLRVDDQVLGVINLDNKPGGFAAEDLEYVQDLANQVSIAIKNAELYERSTTDGLTRLYVRRYFEDLLDQELRRSERTQSRVSLLMFDIDHFKRFNDTYGHQLGDVVIQRVARVAKDNIRDVDMAARYGGEEFVVIMPDTGLDEAWHVGERIRQAVEASVVPHEGHMLKVTVSLGCAEFRTQAASKEELIACADAALYESKHRGRNRTTRYGSELAMYEGDLAGH